VGGTILEGTWTSAFMVTTKYEDDIGEVSEEGMKSLGKTFAAQFQKRGLSFLPRGGAPWKIQHVTIRGLEGVRFSADLDLPEDSVLGHVTTWSLYHRNYVHNVMVFGPRGHAAEIDRFGETMVETIEAEPSDVRMFGEPSITRQLVLSGRNALPFMLVGLVVTAGVVVWDRRKKKLRNAQ
jgi:hypothetical protein